MNFGVKTWGLPVLGVILLGVVLLGCGSNKLEKEVETEASAVKLAREVVTGGYGLITTDELKKRMDQGDGLLIIDAMPLKDSYEKGHIPGAKSFEFPIPDMPAWDTALTAGKSKEDYEALLGPDKDKTIVIYCGFVKCTRSHNGAVWAKKMGYRNILRHPGGLFAWKGAGYPLETAK